MAVHHELYLQVVGDGSQAGSPLDTTSGHLSDKYFINFKLIQTLDFMIYQQILAAARSVSPFTFHSKVSHWGLTHWGLRRVDTMTTEPDPGLECKLLKNTILTRTDLDDADLQQVVLDWITVRLEHSTTGFHLLGPDMENLCLDIQIKRDASVLLRSKHEFSQILSDREVAEAQRTHLFVTKKIEDETWPLKLSKKNKPRLITGWKPRWIVWRLNLRSVRNNLRHLKLTSVFPCRNWLTWSRLRGMNLPQKPTWMRMLASWMNSLTCWMVRMYQCWNPRFYGFYSEETHFDSWRMWDPWTSTCWCNHGCVYRKFTKSWWIDCPTLVDPSSSQKVDLPPVLPENQLGDSAIFPPHSPSPLASEAEEKNVDEGRRRVLIVPPGHDVPIKQTMVNIFAPGSKETVAQKPQDVPTQEPKEPGSETSQAPVMSCILVILKGCVLHQVRRTLSNIFHILRMVQQSRLWCHFVRLHWTRWGSIFWVK